MMDGLRVSWLSSLPAILLWPSLWLLCPTSVSYKDVLIGFRDQPNVVGSLSILNRCVSTEDAISK